MDDRTHRVPHLDARPTLRFRQTTLPTRGTLIVLGAGVLWLLATLWIGLSPLLHGGILGPAGLLTLLLEGRLQGRPLLAWSYVRIRHIGRPRTLVHRAGPGRGRR